MSKLLDLLNKNKLTLIVDLPQNSVALAKAALEGGADAIKVNLTQGFEEERPRLEDILDAIDIPLGITPGEKTCATEEEIEKIIEMGFDFLDMNLEYMPPWLLQKKGIMKIAILNEKYTIDKLIGLGSLGIDALEAAIVPSSGYGKELLAGDLQNYIAITISSELPIIVPTQRAIKLSEVAIIHDTGIKGLILEGAVTGKTVPEIKKAVREFKFAIDDL